MAVANKAIIANLTQYVETLNANNELVITAKFGATSFSQTIPCPPPCLLMFDPSTLNFNAVHDMRDVQPGWQFVSIILAIT